MNKIFYSCCYLLLIAFNSCKSDTNTISTADTTVVDSTKFFPLVDYIKNDVDNVKHVPYFIYKIRTLNKKKDSVNLTVADFEKYAELFYQFEITKQPLKKQLKETSFHDNDIKCNTLVYSPVNTKLDGVRNVTILLDESTDKVKNIFIQTTHLVKDTTIYLNLQWKPRRSFRITKITQAKNYDNEESNYICWNEVSK